jgi:hypothetical protein
MPSRQHGWLHVKSRSPSGAAAAARPGAMAPIELVADGRLSIASCCIVVVWEEDCVGMLGRRSFAGTAAGSLSGRP